ncbi:unnamed protein product [Durusdinium trenchii]|uniref:RRM domain-containing protein n=2 Tax=Durusdinium trenchii TaxID=1381693 RepID=A0ABP0KYX3_9DINO
MSEDWECQFAEPTKEEIDGFVIENRHFLSDTAEALFRNMDKRDQRFVMQEGGLSNCRDTIAILRSRARHGCWKAWLDAHQDRPDDMLEKFVVSNQAWMNQEAEDLLRSLKQEQALGVIERGSFKNCRDPVALIKKRLKDAKAGRWSGVPIREDISKEGENQGNRDRAAESRAFKDRERQKWLDLKQQDPHDKALREDRSLCCMGLPPLWGLQQIRDFFNNIFNNTEDQVEGVFLRTAKPVRGQQQRSASIDFVTVDGARSAALACDRLEIEDQGETFVLSCSIRHKVEGTGDISFIYPARGEVDPKKALAEARCIYISKIPVNTTEEQVKELVEDFGEVEAVHMLPSNGINLACFVTMVSPGEAAFAIRGLNNAQAFGSILSASYQIQKNVKKRKIHPEEELKQWYPVEIRNFPHWTLAEDIKATILSVGPGPQRVRILHYDPEPALSVARAYFKEEEDRDAILKALKGHEITPGYFLNSTSAPRTSGTGAAFTHTPQPGQLDSNVAMANAWIPATFR